MRLTKCDACLKKKGNDSRILDWEKLYINKEEVDLCPVCAKRIQQSIEQEFEAIQKETRGRLEDDEND